jgi:hypothetical protein
MHGLKKPLGVILLLTVMGLGGTSAFADGVTEVPARTITQPNSLIPENPPDQKTETTNLMEMLTYLVTILPL